MNRHRNSAAFLALFLAIALSYGSSLTHQFAYDDSILIIHNPAIFQSEHSFQGMVNIFLRPTPPGNLYRPITIFSFCLNHLWDGLNPWSYHLVNLLLHLGTAFLVYLLALRILRNWKLAILSSALFALHPALVEAVANISGRSDLLAAFFGIAAILLLTGQEKIAASKLILGTAALIMAALSKESALVVLGLIVVMPPLGAKPDSFTLRGFIAQKRASLLAAITACSAALALRYLALGEHFIFTGQGRVILPENPILHLGFIDRIIPALRILGEYIFLMILPLNLSADYSLMPELFEAATYTVCGLAAVVLFLAFCLIVWLLRERAYSIFGLWFLIAFALTSNIFFPIGTIMGERLLYLPAAGFIPFMVAAIAESTLGSGVKLMLATLAILGSALLTTERLPVWRNNDSLFRQTVLDAPNSPKSHYNLGVHLFLHTKDLSGAEREFKRTIELFPNHILALRTLADIQLKRGDKEQLRYWYNRILEVNPGDQRVLENIKKLDELSKQGG